MQGSLGRAASPDCGDFIKPSQGLGCCFSVIVMNGHDSAITQECEMRSSGTRTHGHAFVNGDSGELATRLDLSRSIVEINSV